MINEEDVDVIAFRASKARHEARERALAEAVEWQRRALEAEVKALAAEAKIAEAIEVYKAGPIAFHEGFRTALAMYETLTGNRQRSLAANIEALRQIKDHERNGGEF